jgi:hypothetical protein
VKLKMEGAREMERALAQLPKSTARGVARRAMKKALVPVKAQAEATIQAQSAGSGRLARSMAITSKLKPRQAAQVRAEGVRKDQVVMYVGSGAPHAHLIENGTQPRVHKKTGKSTGSVRG